MTKKVRVVLNKRGIRNLLKDKYLRQVCADHANKALAKLGDGYETDTFTGKTRSNAMIWASSARAEGVRERSSRQRFSFSATGAINCR